MNIAFRVDASLQIGTGHVMRCLTLADALLQRGAKCCFICRPHHGHLLELITQRGHHAIALPQLESCSELSFTDTAHAYWLGVNWATDAQDTLNVLSEQIGNQIIDWLVVDHYSLDSRWEQALRLKSQRIMVIDDLADRAHDCDLLLDQNLGRKEQDYYDLLKGEPVILLGPKYALLRPEFAALRQQSLARRSSCSKLRHLLITMGGVDKDNFTGMVLNALQACLLPSDLHISVVMGSHAPWLAQVQAQAGKIPWRTEVFVDINNMACLMADCDLAIGAAGSTSWERCCLGLPTLQIVLAQNQEFIAQALNNAGAALTLDGQDISKSLTKKISTITTQDHLKKISSVCSSIANGHGATLVSRYMNNEEIL
jgi:UDP-2,4-diacetamido-2,4,6-trideoxy-beta-L-altropyranose hydrolase